MFYFKINFVYLCFLFRWYVEVPLPHACAFSSCISNDYALWLIGGCTVSRNPKEKSLISCSSVLKLSLSKKCKWKPVASLLYPRHALTAVLHGIVFAWYLLLLLLLLKIISLNNLFIYLDVHFCRLQYFYLLLLNCCMPRRVYMCLISIYNQSSLHRMNSHDPVKEFTM